MITYDFGDYEQVCVMLSKRHYLDSREAALSVLQEHDEYGSAVKVADVEEGYLHPIGGWNEDGDPQSIRGRGTWQRSYGQTWRISRQRSSTPGNITRTSDQREQLSHWPRLASRDRRRDA